MLGLANVAALRVRKGVAVGHVGFNVEHGSLVKEVDALNLNKRVLNAKNTGGAKANRVGAMGRTGGEGATANVRAAGGNDCRVPVFIEMEPGNDPKVVKAVQVGECGGGNLIAK